MLEAPVQWLVRELSWLPDPLRPGAFLVVLALLPWFLITRGVATWHACCRAVAVVIDLTVGLTLFPEYAITTARQRRGEPPSNATLVTGDVAERMLDSAARLYRAHPRETTPRRGWPWKPCLVVLLASVVAWEVMDRAPASSAVALDLSKAFDVWRDVERWAHVDRDRRAAPGPNTLPSVRRVERHGRRVLITLHCFKDVACHGTLTIHTASHRTLTAKAVDVRARAVERVRLRLSRQPADALHGLRIHVTVG